MKSPHPVIFENIQYLCKKKKKEKYSVMWKMNATEKKIQQIKRGFELETPKPSVRCSTN
jgi:hypothetical protein